MSWRERLVDGLRFIVRPTFVAEPMPWGRDAALALITVFAGACALDFLIWLVIDEWNAQADFLPASSRQYDSISDMLFKALLLAPVLEEALFRGWLSGRVAGLRFAAFGFVAMACLIASNWAGEALSVALSLGGEGLAFVGLVQWLDRRGRQTQVPDWFRRHFHWLVWGSTLVFALIHVGNHAAIDDPRGLLIMTSQLIGGFALAYVRTRLGLAAAMAYHAAYNVLILINLGVAA
jgi:membrane protease YdiL (CAAX protease family)